jgi:hypothetical protein
MSNLQLPLYTLERRRGNVREGLNQSTYVQIILLQIDRRPKIEKQEQNVSHSHFGHGNGLPRGCLDDPIFDLCHEADVYSIRYKRVKV